MSVTTPQFTQVGSLGLYQLSAIPIPGLSGYWAGYLPSSQLPIAPTLSLDTAWSDVGGVYLFLNQTPTVFTDFLNALQRFLGQISPTGLVRCLWISNPNDASTVWRFQILPAVATVGPPVQWTVPRQAIYSLGAYHVMVSPGTVLAEGSSTFGYGIQIPGSGLQFLSRGSGYPVESGTGGIPFTGSSLGTWVGTLNLNQGSSTPDDFARLGVEFRYATPAPPTDSDGGVALLRMPLLSQNGASLNLYLSFDPLNLLNPTRTNLGFFPADGSGTSPNLKATFVTTLGYTTSLQPLPAASGLGAAQLAFCSSPLFLGSTIGDVYSDYYLAPNGAFSLSTDTPLTLLNSARFGTAADHLALGLSGLEYVALPAASGTIMAFQSGQNAFAPSAIVGLTTPETANDGPALTGLATTAYATLLPPSVNDGGLTYYAQPAQAPLYVGSTALGPGFMEFHEMPAAVLSTYGSQSTGITYFPVGAYTGIDPTLVPNAKVLEEAALAPARRNAIGLPTMQRQQLGSTPVYAVTPQGLVAELSSNGMEWQSVVIGNMVNSNDQIQFTEVNPTFQAALQSNELFFVASNIANLMDGTSVGYQLTPASMPFLLAAGVPQGVVANLTTLLSGTTPPFKLFATEDDFVNTIQSTAGTYLSLILPIAGQLKVDLDGWVFQLSPRSWRTDPESPTVMLFKYCNRSLESLVADTSAWGWQEAATDPITGTLLPTQKVIQEIFKQASEAADGTSYALFYDQVVSDPAWNGVLFLNAPVSTAEFPDQLQFLLAGIDSNRFYAHHVGFSLTPFDTSTGAIVLGQTAVFGLIDYQDPKDLFLSSTVPFAFKTLALSVRFANAMIADFGAQVELMINQILGAELTKDDPTRGNNLILNGSYQTQSGAPTYAFSLQSSAVYSAARSMLVSMEVLGLQLQTSTGTNADGSVSVDFILSGNLRLFELEHFDLFSFGKEFQWPSNRAQFDGYLRFGNLAVRMAFALATPTQQTFTSSENRISFDLVNSKARPNALAANFPVRITSLVSSPNLSAPGDPPQGKTPEDMGYVSISAPIDQSLLSPPWYGFVYTLDLGTLGALSGSIGLSMTMIAAWATGDDDYTRPVYVGLQLPDAKTAGVDWPLQGVMRLGFRSFQFVASDDETTGNRSYMLRLRRFALSILGWSFPPGNTDVFLFGNPDGSGRASLGWYAAYATKPGEEKSAITTTRRRQSGRRQPVREEDR